MVWFKNLTVGSKLIGSFLIVAAIGAIIGIQGIHKELDAAEARFISPKARRS